MSEIRVDSITDEVGTSSPDFPNGILKSSLPAGSVIQVVSAFKNDAESASVGANSYLQLSDLNISITPSSSNSKFLLIGHVAGSTDDSSRNPNLGFNFTKNGLEIAQPINFGSRPPATVANALLIDSENSMSSISATFLDSPSTTSAITYGASLINMASATQVLYVNRTEGDLDDSNARPRTTSSLVVMEIAG